MFGILRSSQLPKEPVHCWPRFWSMPFPCFSVLLWHWWYAQGVLVLRWPISAVTLLWIPVPRLILQNRSLSACRSHGYTRIQTVKFTFASVISGICSHCYDSRSFTRLIQWFFSVSLLEQLNSVNTHPDITITVGWVSKANYLSAVNVLWHGQQSAVVTFLVAFSIHL